MCPHGTASFVVWGGLRRNFGPERKEAPVTMTTTSQNSARTVETYLFFDGRAEEAAEFYKRAVDAEVTSLMRFEESPEPDQSGCGPVDKDKVMHMEMRVGSTLIMASDGRCQGAPNFQGFALALTVSNEAEADRYFGALSEGGQVQMPLAKTFFSPRFGMVTDRFGVTWMVLLPQ